MIHQLELKVATYRVQRHIEDIVPDVKPANGLVQISKKQINQQPVQAQKSPEAAAE